MGTHVGLYSPISPAHNTQSPQASIARPTLSPGALDVRFIHTHLLLFPTLVHSDKLRKALGLMNETDYPPYIYRMRELDYPPGYRLLATESRLRLYDDASGEWGMREGEEGREG